MIIEKEIVEQNALPEVLQIIRESQRNVHWDNVNTLKKLRRKKEYIENIRESIVFYEEKSEANNQVEPAVKKLNLKQLKNKLQSSYFFESFENIS